MTSFADAEAAADDARFVVDVTAPLTADQTATVVTEAAARLGVPATTMQKLLSNRIGPVTKPVSAATAERVASILTRVGVEVTVRPSEPPASDTPNPSPGPTPGRAPSDTQQQVPEVTPPVESDAVVHDTQLNRGETLKSSGAQGPTTSVAHDRAVEEVPSKPLEAVSTPEEPTALDITPNEPAAPLPDSNEPKMAWPGDWPSTQDQSEDEDLGVWKSSKFESVRLEDEQASPSTLADRPSGVIAGPGRQDASEVETRKPAWFEGQEADSAHWQDTNPFAEADRQDRITRRWMLGIALVVSLGVLVTLQWVYG